MKGEFKSEAHKEWQELMGAIVRGVAAMGGLVLFYVMVLWLVTGDPEYPWQQWVKLQPWMTLLVIGFGVQVGLYAWMKMRMTVSSEATHLRRAAGKASGDARQGYGGQVVMGSGVSSGAMVACCAHHAAEIAPFLGVAGVATVLTEYQKELLILGIVANGVGIGVMARRLRRL